MATPRLRIVNMPDAADWEKVREVPRFLQPLEFSRSPCANCSASCCSSQVDLTMVEALRIEVILEVPMLDFILVTTVKPEEKTPGKTPLIPLDAGPSILSFKRVKPRGSCVWLHDVNGRGRCSIHGIRPGLCRGFPFDAVWGKRRITVGSQTMCPTRWLKTDATEARLQRDYEAWDKDTAAEQRLIAAWRKANVENRDFATFHAFALRRQAKSLGVNAEELLRPPRRRLTQRLW